MVVVLVEALPVSMIMVFTPKLVAVPILTGKRRFYCESHMQKLTKIVLRRIVITECVPTLYFMWENRKPRFKQSLIDFDLLLYTF